MKMRVITSVVGLAVLAVVLCFFDTFIFNVAVAAVALIAIHEVYMAFSLKFPWIYVAFVPVTLLVMLNDGRNMPGWLSMPAVLYAMLLFLSCCVIGRSQTLHYADVGGMALFSAVILASFWSMLYLRASFPNHYDAIYFILLALGFAWGGDTCAYFAGRAFGKHKLAPIVSPHKTVEGAVGGVLGSVLTGLLITAAYSAALGGPSCAVADARYYGAIALIGAVSSVLGILGDLTASAVKRQCGIKDYGTIFPGHGGILDRFDSVLFILPFLALILSAVVGH